nr:MAG TPA: hypothetical protein [Caudoviricetes sp.]
MGPYPLLRMQKWCVSSLRTCPSGQNLSSLVVCIVNLVLVKGALLQSLYLS